ncbi:hypothetical protein [Candidatus Mycolicibacterium alkanivorans]|uniref:Uncharacterized protein n=1 Tax=Candidatus Mycolicibacterium alkanivorans TaxID=2954114 RepID=A0ABS9YZT8_9MYCO|nr:hypothetical protein [Candidatus Mycolicibacterium alkanivorans]
MEFTRPEHLSPLLAEMDAFIEAEIKPLEADHCRRSSAAATTPTWICWHESTGDDMTNLHNLLADPATAGVWNLVPARSSVRFKNKTLWGLVAVNGEFTDVSGDGQITVDRSSFGVSGNMFGMMPTTTTLIADLVFAKA